MIEGIGSVVIDFFKLLTPKEVSRLTESATFRESKNTSAVEMAQMALNLDGTFSQSSESLQVSRKKKKKKHEEEELEEGKAKIIPLDQEVTNADYEQVEPLKKVVGADYIQENHSQPSTGHVQSAKPASVTQLNPQLNHQLKPLGEVKTATSSVHENSKQSELDSILSDEKPSASVFLLNERQKVKKSCQRLTNQIAIKTYKDSETKESKEVSDSELLGILVNKKQF